MTHSHTYRQKDLLSYKNKNVAIYGFGPTSFDLIVFILKNSEAKSLTIIGSA